MDMSRLIYQRNFSGTRSKHKVLDVVDNLTNHTKCGVSNMIFNGVKLLKNTAWLVMLMAMISRIMLSVLTKVVYSTKKEVKR
jgi:hypothetical protein